MKKRHLLFFFLISLSCFAQQDAWVYFKDKPSAATFLETPTKMLSPRSLERRSIQKIALDLHDVPLENAYRLQVRNSTGISILAQSKWLNALHVRGSQANINALKNLAFVSRVDFADKSLNQNSGAKKLATSKKTLKIQKTKVEYAYGSSSNQIKMLQGDVLHQQNFTGAGKIIAVMDSGFPGVNTALPFKRLRDNNQILGGYNYVQRDPNFYSGGSHGTSVLSTMGGYTENVLVGTAPDASYYLFITENESSENPVEESLWVEAAEKADSLGVDVINTSLGYFDFDNPAYNHTYSEMNGKTAFMSRAADIAFDKGMLVVASAGNSGNSSSPTIAVPADAISVLAIGAVNSSEVRTSFSSIGPSFDGRIKPEVMAQGEAAVVSDQFGNSRIANGTSFSSPIMAGLVACLWQALPQKTNKEIRDIIIRSADRFLIPDNQYGYGVPDFASALNTNLGLTFPSQQNIIVFPNPVMDIVTLQLPTGVTNGMFSVYNVLGQKMFEQTISQSTTDINLQSITNGIYFYRYLSADYSASGKLVKQ